MKVTEWMAELPDEATIPTGRDGRNLVIEWAKITNPCTDMEELWYAVVYQNRSKVIAIFPNVWEALNYRDDCEK